MTSSRYTREFTKMKNSEAYDILASEFGFQSGDIATLQKPAPSKERPIGPPPPDAPAPSFVHPKFGPASERWAYLDIEGKLRSYVSRHDTDDGKEIIPWAWDLEGRRWRMWAQPKPRPLFGLEELRS